MAPLGDLDGRGLQDVAVCYEDGLGRVLSIIEMGWPDREILTVMVLELGVVPIIVVWQRMQAKKARATGEI